jgi:hypothetical protein
MSMSWKRGDVELRAGCRMIGGEHAASGDYCEITVAHDQLDRVERDKQQQADDAARLRNAPEPPPI